MLPQASELTHHMPRPDHGQVKQVAWCIGHDSPCRRRTSKSGEREKEKQRECVWRGGQGRPLPPSCARLAIYLFYMVSYHLFRCACRHERSATGFLSNPIARRAGIRTRPNSGRRARSSFLILSSLLHSSPLPHFIPPIFFFFVLLFPFVSPSRLSKFALSLSLSLSISSLENARSSSSVAARNA